MPPQSDPNTNDTSSSPTDDELSELTTSIADSQQLSTTTGSSSTEEESPSKKCKPPPILSPSRRLLEEHQLQFMGNCMFCPECDAALVASFPTDKMCVASCVHLKCSACSFFREMEPLRASCPLPDGAHNQK